MKKIAYILPYLEKGGTETHVLELVKGFQQQYDLTLISPPGPRLKDFTKYKINFIPFTSTAGNPLKGIFSFRNAIKKIKKSSIDLVHIHAAGELLFLTNLFLKKVPIIFTVHGYHGKHNSIDYKFASLLNNRYAEKTIAVSRSEKNKLQSAGLKEEKLKLIYNGVSRPEKLDSSALPPEIKDFIHSGKQIIGTAGRLEEAKGIKYLLEALSKIKRKDIYLLIIGTGSLEAKLKELSVRLGIAEQTYFTGFVDNIHDYFKAMDLFVIPSLQEPFGLVSAEAMAHSLPVIGTSAGGIPEVVQNERTGFIVEPGNSLELAKKISLLLDNKELAGKMGANGYARYSKLFNLEKMITETNQIYQQYI